jgi:hypothetical protein
MRISVARPGFDHARPETRRRLAASATVAGALALVSSPARAQQLPSSINTPPSGPGTAEKIGPVGRAAVRPGLEASAAIGTGFADTYGLGFEGRVGYTFANGVYAGGAGQYYLGHSLNDQQAHAGFVGGEVGYKLFPTDALEVRPYVFAGPAFITQVARSPVPTAPPNTISRTDFALQPGVLAMYHFGGAFVGGDAHVMLFPSPNTIALLASGGFGF